MKTALILLAIMVFTMNCSKSKNSTVISVMRDDTEPDFVLNPDSEKVLNFIKLDADIWQEVTFRYCTISSMVQNKRTEYHLSKANALFGNEIERRQSVENFKIEISSAFEDSNDSIRYLYSSIWKPLVNEIIALQSFPDTSQITLLVYSDLQENNPWFSVLDASNQALLHTNPKAIEKLYLDTAQEIKPTKSNMKVIVIYQPRTMQQDEAFLRMRMVYEKVFEGLQIPIEFTTNANF